MFLKDFHTFFQDLTRNAVSIINQVVLIKYAKSKKKKKKEHTRKNAEGGKENLIEAIGSNILEIMNGLVSLKYCLGICFSNP